MASRSKTALAALLEHFKREKFQNITRLGEFPEPGYILEHTSSDLHYEGEQSEVPAQRKGERYKQNIMSRRPYVIQNKTACTAFHRSTPCSSGIACYASSSRLISSSVVVRFANAAIISTMCSFMSCSSNRAERLAQVASVTKVNS